MSKYFHKETIFFQHSNSQKPYQFLIQMCSLEIRKYGRNINIFRHSLLRFVDKRTGRKMWHNYFELLGKIYFVLLLIFIMLITADPDTNLVLPAFTNFQEFCP